MLNFFGKILKNLEVRPDLHLTYLKKYTHFNVLTEIVGLYNIFQQYPLIHDDINMLSGVFTEEIGCRNVSFVIAYRCSILTKTV